jgi:hypothetical protein
MPETPPDAVISMRPDLYAPRAARYFVGTVDRPSPDLRDVVVLLTSELVTRAVLLCPSDRDEFVELRIWMPAEVVRVELRAARELISARRPAAHGRPRGSLVGRRAGRAGVHLVRDRSPARSTR